MSESKAAEPINVTVKYVASDGYRITRKYKTRKGLMNFVHEWVGEYVEDTQNTFPTKGRRVSNDGVGACTWYPTAPEIQKT